MFTLAFAFSFRTIYSVVVVVVVVIVPTAAIDF